MEFKIRELVTYDLKHYAERGPVNVVVCGDSGNDADMVAWAGLGCAMANGTDKLKAIADYVCQNSNSYGVLEVMHRFFPEVFAAQ